MSSARILLVEDDFLIRLTLCEALADEGFDVVQAGSGDEALRIIAEQDGFDLLLTDVRLPGDLDGTALARAARHLFPELLIIFVTGWPEMVSRETNASRDLFIAKPYLPSEICAAAHRMLNA